MKEFERLEKFAKALDALMELRESLDDDIESLKKLVQKKEELAAQLAKTQSELSQAKQTEKQSTEALSKIESGILEAMNRAQKAVVSPDLSVDERLKLLAHTRTTFDGLKGIGFEVWIPTIGDKVDSDKHSVQGKTESEQGADRVADVVSWGYKFPSGNGKAAEVIVGDGSLKKGEKKTEAPKPPTAKAGISMVFDEPEEPKKTKPKPKSDGESLFDSLAEAAKKNKPQP